MGFMLYTFTMMFGIICCFSSLYGFILGVPLIFLAEDFRSKF